MKQQKASKKILAYNIKLVALICLAHCLIFTPQGLLLFQQKARRYPIAGCDRAQ